MGVFVNTTYIGTLSANNATYLNGQPASYYTNATNITTGTLPWTQAPSGTVNTSGNFTYTGVETFNANVFVNGAVVSVGNSTVNVSVNSTTFTGTALTANNSTNLGGQAAAYYTNATNITTGTLPWAQAPSGTVNTSGAFTFTGTHTHNANVTFGTTAALIANTSAGTSGQVLTSNGTTVYWSAVSVSPSGANTQVQFNDSGSLNATAGFVFTKTTNTVSVSNAVSANIVAASGSNTANRLAGTVGTLRYNTDTGLSEYYMSTGWAGIMPGIINYGLVTESAVDSIDFGLVTDVATIQLDFASQSM